MPAIEEMIEKVERSLGEAEKGLEMLGESSTDAHIERMVHLAEKCKGIRERLNRYEITLLNCLKFLQLELDSETVVEVELGEKKLTYTIKPTGFLIPGNYSPVAAHVCLQSLGAADPEGKVVAQFIGLAIEKLSGKLGASSRNLSAEVGNLTNTVAKIKTLLQAVVK